MIRKALFVAVVAAAVLGPVAASAGWIEDLPLRCRLAFSRKQTRYLRCLSGCGKLVSDPAAKAVCEGGCFASDVSVRSAILGESICTSAPGPGPIGTFTCAPIAREVSACLCEDFSNCVSLFRSDRCAADFSCAGDACVCLEKTPLAD